MIKMTKFTWVLTVEVVDMAIHTYKKIYLNKIKPALHWQSHLYTRQLYMTTKRKAISKRMRFEVLKRDAFTCQYCGKQPPDTILHMDHIKPVSKGGKNSLLNLVTSCVDCNLGKSDKELSDDSAIKKQQSQLSAMAEKKAQIEMMIEWRESLLEADELLTDSAEELINKYLYEDDCHVSESGKPLIRKAIKKHGYQRVVDAIERLYVSNSDFKDGWGTAIKYCKEYNKNNIHYIKGILRNNCNWFNEKRFYAETKSIVLDDGNYNFMVECAKDSKNLDSFLSMIEEII